MPAAEESIGARHPEWLRVLPTRLKGNGLFSREPIPRGSFLFDYEGERIDEVEYRRRYPDRISDYTVGVKKNGVVTFIDGVDPALSGLPRYMNHSAARPNVKMRVDLGAEPPRVLMYVIKDIEPGDELVWNYGIGYVQAHPNLIEDTANRKPAPSNQKVKRPAAWPPTQRAV
jgi:SET domain-containing protein